MTPTKQQTDGGLRAASPIALLAGVWLFVSPWMTGSYMLVDAWNNWIVGAGIVILAVVRLVSPTTAWISWPNCFLAIWTIASPWIYGYNVDHRRLVTSLCVGIAVLFSAGLYKGMTAP